MSDNSDFIIKTMDISAPPVSGPGSGKEAWIVYAAEVVKANMSLSSYIRDMNRALQEQVSLACFLQAELEARPKAKGIRQRLPADKVARIEVSILDGASTREAAQRHGVSAMTISRIAKRMKATG